MSLPRQRTDSVKPSNLHFLIWLLAVALFGVVWQFVFRGAGVENWRNLEGTPVFWVAVIASFLLLTLAVLASWTLVALRRHWEAQQQAQANLRTITRGAPGVLYQYLLRPDGHASFPFISDVINDTYQLSPSELALDAASAFEMIHPDDLAGVQACIQASFRTMTRCRQEFRVRSQDGTMHWHSSNAMPQCLVDGSVLWHGFMANITERKQSQELLITLNTAIEQSPVSIIISDLKGIIQYVNPRFEQVTGYTRDEAIGQSPKFLSSGEKSPSEYQGMWQLLLAGKIWTGEFHNRCKDGSLVWEQASISPIFDERGKPIHYLAIKQDITEHKLAQVQLRIAAIAFESEDGMFITDAAGTILRVNPAFSRITLYEAEDAIGKKPSLLRSGRHDAVFYADMQASLAKTGAWQGEIWNRRQNGEIYPGWLSISAVRDEQQTLTHYVATLADISQRKSAEAQVQYLAFYDPLTSLPNRRFLCDRLTQSLASIRRNHRCGALLLVDLAQFRLINETHGHELGDLLLKQVAERLNDGVREGDTVARLEADKFVVMLQDLSVDLVEAAVCIEAVGQKILLALSQPYHFSQSSFDVRASLGVALFNENSASAEDLLHCADLALRRAKAAGQNTLQFFDSDLQSVA